MAKFKRVHSGTIVIACLLPFGLSACGSSASAPAAGSTSASTSKPTGGSTTGSGGGTVASTGTTVTGAAGNTVGTIVETTGTTVTATGASLTHGALNNPLGITVLNTSTPGTGAGNIVDANVLSTTAPSTAPVQTNVLSNGQIISASIANPTSTQIPAVSPLVDGVAGIVTTIPGTAPVLSTVTTGSQTAVAGLASVTAPINGAATPLNPLLNVTVGKTTLIGSSTTPSAITAAVLTPGQLLGASVSQQSSGTAHGLLSSLPAGGGTPTSGLTGGLTGGSSLTGLTGGLTNGLGSSPLGTILPK